MQQICLWTCILFSFRLFASTPVKIEAACPTILTEEPKREITIFLYDTPPIADANRVIDGRFPAVFSDSDRHLVVTHMKNAGDEGYELFDCRPGGDRKVGAGYELRFVKNKDLVAAKELNDVPTFVATQHAALDATWPDPPEIHRGDLKSRRTNLAAVPSGTPLTRKTMDSFEPGTYAYVRHEGESFLRLARGVSYVGQRLLPPVPSVARPPFGGMDFKHDSIAGREGVMVAGEVDIFFNPAAQHNEVRYVNIQSGSYLFYITALPIAVKALWNQGVYPPVLYLAMKGEDETSYGFFFTLTSNSKTKLTPKFFRSYSISD